MKIKRLTSICIIFLFATSALAAPPVKHRAKYVFFFIGDGMGLVQAQLADEYLKAVHGQDTGLSFMAFPGRGFVTTSAQDRLITGSAAAGTALASGYKTSTGAIGKNRDRSCELHSISELCAGFGMKTAVLSSVFLNHATPASFYAHSDSRQSLYEIGMQIPSSGIDFFAGGSISKSRGATGTEPDAYLAAEMAGYAVVRSLAGVDSLPKGRKVILATDKALGTEILTCRINRPAGYPSLGDLTAKAISHLYSPAGFMIMVEGGAIDWACHGNDAANTLHETLDLDLAVRQALAFYKKHPDETLIVVTADHETGGMALGCAETEYESHLAVLRHQRADLGKIADTLTASIAGGADFDKCLALIGRSTGLGPEVALTGRDTAALLSSYGHSLYYLQGDKHRYADVYGGNHPMAVCAVKMLACKAGIGWTTYSHTAAAVPVYAVGVDADQCARLRDNTDIMQMIMQQVSGKSQKGSIVCPPAR